jgi:predicted metal-binding membrane protein
LSELVDFGATARRGLTFMGSERTSERAFIAASALIFAASAAATISWSRSMSAMDGMSMPGDWTMSTTLICMPGQTRLAAASFLGMWVVMMAAMMTPSLIPMLRRYRKAVAGAGGTRLGWLTALAAVGYFFAWTLIGLAVYPLGVGLAGIEMQRALARLVPIAVALVVLIAGAFQFTGWKMRHLACCREAPGSGEIFPADAGTAWRHGLRLGVRCIYVRRQSRLSAQVGSAPDR